MSDSRPKHPDYAWTDSEGREVCVRVEGPSTHTFVYKDSSELIVTQDADGNREYRVTPWPPVEAAGGPNP